MLTRKATTVVKAISSKLHAQISDCLSTNKINKRTVNSFASRE